MSEWYRDSKERIYTGTQWSDGTTWYRWEFDDGAWLQLSKKPDGLSKIPEPEMLGTLLSVEHSELIARRREVADLRGRLSMTQVRVMELEQEVEALRTTTTAGALPEQQQQDG